MEVIVAWLEWGEVYDLENERDCWAVEAHQCGADCD